ncbi:MAG: hypothetical protein JRI35_00740 [Deltaproteobacteria bacterium]|nr:hypothetical protein [Deltaproteobacteria bacterium]MBW1946479.1 hypothetical protein [Deltaproteobacteria bacterium]MBW1965973.1 hypothetical protein [Deltaproteobacteria bacterium]MBW2097429.1 hypothetical protein [Deltaproteobacteria bacterium]
MELNIINSKDELPVKRGYTISLIIKKFRGHKDVEIHLFRPDWDEKEARHYDWSKLLGDPIDRNAPFDPVSSRKVLLESFTTEERDIILDYMKKRYVSRLSAINSRPLDFPIPLGLIPLSEIPEDGNIGRIRFEEIPNYTLSFPVHGLYILSQHEPVKEEI